MNRAARTTSDRSAIRASRRSALRAAAAFVVTGVALAAAFFPFMFNQWLPRDDEGVFTFALRESLAGHGHLYSTIWSDLYGPFYYLFMSTVFRLIHQQPSLENARWIVLILTTTSTVLFGASVWRLTRNLPASLVCQVGTFLILIQVEGNVPLHPGSLGVFLIAVIAFAATGYAARPRTAPLVVAGVALGALVMTKVNVGGLAAIALVFALVVGNRRTPRWFQVLVAVAAVLAPIALVSQNIAETWASTFAIVVAVTLVAMVVLMVIDPLETTRWPLVPIAAGAAGAVVCSLAFPIVTGTPLSDVFQGVFVRPLTFGDQLAVAANIKLNWTTFAITAFAVGAAVVFRSLPAERIRAHASWTHATLAAAALWVLGLGVTTYAGGWVIARWLPALVLLPALVVCCASPAPVRLALRILVPLAALQMLVAYPVPGSQVGWATVAMVVPCAVGLAVAVDHSRVWRRSHVLLRFGAAGFLCVGLVVASNVWPVGLWRNYSNNTELGLPGTGLVRVDPATAATLRDVTAQLRANCDTFYGYPDLNSFFIFTRLPPVTGMLANGGPAGLTAKQQRQVVDSLRAKEAAGERVCILRDGTVSPLETGSLAAEVNQYLKVVATVGNYSIARHI